MKGLLQYIVYTSINLFGSLICPVRSVNYLNENVNVLRTMAIGMGVEATAGQRSKNKMC